MLSCIAIDDEPKALDMLERYCAKTNLISLKAVFREALTALDFLKNEKIDLIFLDINMPELNGIQFLHLLEPGPMVVFTTAYSEYAVESYNLMAIDYLLKPVDFDRFLKAVIKANDLFSLKQKEEKLNITTQATIESDFIFMKSGTQLHKVKTEDILYLEKEGNYMIVHTAQKKILIRENMADIFDRFPSEAFVRIHKSYIVALRQIEIIENDQVIINKTSIPIGSTYRDELARKITKFIR